MSATGTVYVVDDDDAVRSAVSLLLKSVGLNVVGFSSAASFLDSFDPLQPACILLDVRMPGMSGTEAQSRLNEFEPRPVIVFISGHADVPVAVSAMKAGAVDFVQKPFNDQQLIDCIHRAIGISVERVSEATAGQDYQARLGSLTPRESQVMSGIVDGKANKVIAGELNVSERTVEIHRANVMRKMKAGSVAALVRMSVGQLSE